MNHKFVKGIVQRAEHEVRDAVDIHGILVLTKAYYRYNMYEQINFT